MTTKSEQARIYGELGREHDENREANELTAKLIKQTADNFDIDIAQCLHSLVNQIRQHRGIDIESARKIVFGLLEVGTE